MAARKIYPCLLGGISIERVDQVCCADVTGIPMAKGSPYLVIMDWASRAVLAWRLSNALGTGSCVEAFKEALSRYDPLEIFNPDPGRLFTKDGESSGNTSSASSRHRTTPVIDGLDGGDEGYSALKQ